MTENVSVVNAKKSIEELLKSLGIQRVVCVDDIYAPSIEEPLVDQEKLSPEQLLEVLPEFGTSVPDDAAVRTGRFRTVFEKLEPSRQLECAKKISEIVDPTGNNLSVDDKHASALRDLISTEFLSQLSLTEWEKEKQKIVPEASSKPTLFLFDQDLSKDGGTTDGGMKIISSLLSGDNHVILCGLLTHTVKRDNQYPEWERLASENSLDKNRFLVIPKESLEQEPLDFARMLKLIALSVDFKILKDQTKDIIEEAHKKAAEEVKEISVLDFEHIIFEVAEKEGIWEPEMLFRLFALFHRLEVRSLIPSKPDIEKIVDKLRSVRHIPTGSKMAAPPNSWIIQQKELYETADHLIKGRLPIELGDVFVKTETTSKKAYILLAQPCDLLVRTNGKRAPEPKYLPLAEISLLTELTESGEPAKTDASKKEEIPYFGEKPGENFVVNLKNVHYVNPDILDMCVFSNDGSANLDLNKDTPTGIRPSWGNRYKKLKENFENPAREYDSHKPEAGESAEKSEFKSSIRKQIEKGLTSGPFKGSFDRDGGQNVVKFNIKRIKRLTRQRANALLLEYAMSICRPAFDSDFGN